MTGRVPWLVTEMIGQLTHVGKDLAKFDTKIELPVLLRGWCIKNIWYTPKTVAHWYLTTSERSHAALWFSFMVGPSSQSITALVDLVLMPDGPETNQAGNDGGEKGHPIS